jgi:hypothetical protein
VARKVQWRLDEYIDMSCSFGAGCEAGTIGSDWDFMVPDGYGRIVDKAGWQINCFI